MTTTEQAAALIAEAAQIARVDPSELRNVLNAPEIVQRAWLGNFRAMDWTDASTPAGTRMLEILDVLGRIGADVSGVAGAASAVAALKSL